MMQRMFGKIGVIAILAVAVSACSGNGDGNGSDDGKNEKDTTASKQVSEQSTPPNQADPSAESDPPASSDTSQQKVSTSEIPEASKNSRIAYVSSLEVLDAMPEVQQADQQLQQFAQGLDQELKRQQQQLQQKYQQYQQDTDVSEAVMQTRSQELQQMQQRIMKLQQDSEEELANRREDLYEPIRNKVDRAIKRVAKEYGYTHVMDITGGSLVYAEESTNITGLVKQELGVQ